MFEHKSKPLLSRPLFARRLLRNAGAALLIMFVSLGLGMAGYHRFGGLAWLDSFLNASMIMSGMGPVDAMRTGAGKLFAGCYALYCGLTLITASAIIIAPIVHRFFHRFHLEEERDS